MREYRFILFLVFATSPFFSFSQQLFSYDETSNISATKNPLNTIPLNIDKKIEKKIITEKSDRFILNLPFLNKNNIALNAFKFKVYSDDFKIVSLTEDGEKIIEDKPSILSYKLFYKGKSIGVLNFFNNEINATFKFEGKQYEISRYMGEYILFEASNSINQSNFSCAVDEEFKKNSISQQESVTPSNQVCIELAVEVDNYTRNTFSSTVTTTNWALAIIAGVSQIYNSELNTAFVVTYSYVWNTIDPYDSYVNQSSNMLGALANYWITNNGLINRDLVHLLSKRNNTGTGGIAYLDVLCDNSWGYGFSSELNNDTTYMFPNPSYTWNLTAVSHELGHNIGSHHTHWCGWQADPLIPFAGGIIDNCVDVEGSCSNNPTPQLGTIMSYCHTTTGGIVLDFHDVVVSQGLSPGIASATCLTTCDYYGCTDSTAFNYDPNAIVDDSSCIPVIFGCIDSLAANFNILANTSDSSCTYCSALYFNILDVSCNNYNDGVIDLTVQNGVAPYTYVWSGPNNFSANTEDIFNLAGGTYQVTVTDGFGCSETASVLVVNPNPITITNINTTNVSCFGLNNGSVSVTITGGFTPYSIDYGIYNPNALNQGVYTVLVTDSNNCPSDSSTFSILEPGDLLINPIVSDISCYSYNDGSVLTTVTGGTYPYNFSWSGPNNYFSPFQNISNLSSGNYNLNIVDANGCSTSYSVLINEPSLLNNSTVTTNVSCNGGTDGYINISPTGGIQPYSYVWSNGSNLQDQIGVSAGNYSVSISDANGCSLPLINVLITEPPSSVINSIITDVDCFGNSTGSIDISYFPSAAVNQSSYSWSGPNSYISNLEDINNLGSGLYVLTVLENNICNKVVSFMINEPDQIAVIESIQNVNCYGGSDAVVNLGISGGIPIYSTDWFGFNPQSLSIGTYTYTVTDQNSCTYTNSINISQPQQALDVVSSSTPITCNNGSDGTATLLVSGGTAPYSSVWPNTDPLQLNAGFHSFITTDNNGCVFEDSVFIQQPTPLQITEDITDVLCYGENTGTVNLLLSGATPPYQIDWQGANNLSLSSGNYMYDVEDNNGCVISGVVFVGQPASITVQNSVISSTCPNSIDGSVSNIVNGGVSPYTFNWNGLNPQALMEGNYNFLVVDANGCVDSNEVYVPALSNIDVTEFVSNVSCFGFCDGDVSLIIDNGIPPYSVDWFGYQADSLCEGVYTYEVIDNLLCIFTDTIEVGTSEAIQLSISQQNNLLVANCLGGVPPYSYNWWNSLGNISNNTQGITISQPGSYFCVVYDSYNCNSDTISYFVSSTDIIESDPFSIIVFPNPADKEVNISLGKTIDRVKILITDLLGREILNEYFYDTSKIKINTSDFSSSTYFITVNSKEESCHKKIVISD